MLAMENPTRYGRTSNSNSFKQRRSGYEPSDTETEYQQESPWHDLKNDMRPPDVRLVVPDRAQTPTRNISPFGRGRRYSSVNPDYTTPLKTSPPPRRNSSKSPYKPRRLPDTIDDDETVFPKMEGSDVKRNISPFTNSQRSRRHVSPYKPTRGEEPKVSKKFADAESGIQEASRVSERSNYSHRSKSAPKPRPKEIDRKTPSPLSIVTPKPKLVEDRKKSPLQRSLVKNARETHHVRAPSAGEINEMAGMAKLAKITTNGGYQDDIGSSSPGNIFFSREYASFAPQKNVIPKKNIPMHVVIPERDTNSQPKIRVQQKTPTTVPTDIVPYKPPMSRTNSSSTLSRQSTTSKSGFTDGSLRSSESLRKFTANRQKVHKETWFGCIKKGPCRLSKSPERPDVDEASFIGKAFVVENLRQFWAEKHRPSSLNGFTCHKHQAQLLKQLTSKGSCPNFLLKGPSGSGKKALTMALLREIYSEPAWDVNHELRRFHTQENRSMEVVVPITSSAHHVELSLKKEAKNARLALMTLVKEMTRNPITPDISTISFRADYKVIVLYEVDKAAENIQHLIKWIMDCYADSCKLVLCCEDDVDILDSVKSRCEVIKVDAPVTHEIMEVLIQIAKKENFDLPMSFAAKIATKSKQNLRKAIMAMEACKAHNYPFSDEQPIPFGWEEVLTELAAEILADPSPKRLFYTRGKFQKLLVDFVHPKLILQKLVEQFLMGVDASLKRELYYWHSYYDKRLPVGTSALLKLEEFVAKFMSIYRKSFRVHPNP